MEPSWLVLALLFLAAAALAGWLPVAGRARWYAAVACGFGLGMSFCSAVIGWGLAWHGRRARP